MPLIDFSTAALPGSADYSANPGGPGLTISARTNQQALAAVGQDAIGTGAAVAQTVVAPQAAGTAAGHPVSWWVALIVIVIAIKFFAEQAEDSGEFKNVRIGFFNIIVITLSAIVGMIFLKWFFGLYQVPGLSGIIEAA